MLAGHAYEGGGTSAVLEYAIGLARDGGAHRLAERLAL
jgi:hypothetical protein